MRSILIRSRVGADGMLHLDIPSDLVGTEVEVMLILQPIAQPTPCRLNEVAWAPGFFVTTIGGWEGGPLTRESEGEYETRKRS